MKRYHISPEYKKCSVQIEEFIKDGKKIKIETYWRYANFAVESETPPVLLEGQDIYSTLDNVEFLEASDGDTYYDYENMTDEEIAEVEKFLEENDYYQLEEDGWFFGDSVWYFDCPVIIEEIV